MNDREKTSEYKFYDEELHDWINDDELEITLNDIAFNSGWILIEFNSLESLVHYKLEQLLSLSEGTDEIVNMFLSEMTYNQKQTLLTRVYGHYTNYVDKVKNLRNELESIRIRLTESSVKRNRYAHADFTSISKRRFVRVKTKIKTDRVYHTFVKFEKKDMEDDLSYIQQTIELLEDFDERFVDGMNDSDWDDYHERIRG